MKNHLFSLLVTSTIVWLTPVYAQRLLPPPLERPLQHTYRWIYFAPSGTGYAADREVLIRTVDGGNTWTELIDIVRDERSFIYSVSFLNELTFLIYGWGGFYRTTDRGQSFTRLAATGRNLEDPTRPLGTGYAAFVDLQHGWAVAGDQHLRTVDGGQTWTTAYLFLPKHKEVDVIAMFDLQRGLALGN